MAGRIFYGTQALQPELKIIAGTFKPNAGSAIDNDANVGTGFTVARTGTGQYTVTLDDGYPGLISAQATAALNAAAATFMQITSAPDVTTAKTIVFTALTTSSTAAPVATDIAAHANNHVHFVLFLRNTSLTS
jgi:hypothetical protein